LGKGEYKIGGVEKVS